MAYAHEQLRDRLEERARRSARYGRIPEHRWPRRNMDAGGLVIRENTLFIDNTGQEVIGLSAPIGTMTTGPA